ncbi:lysophospholipid acyltransferase family protein [Alienimonas californiensis]|uniref:1-acyl-sn-glycerol-3-phosphate acyltransferase n=1 Tax=Alienimonas californiensis TaxID=2527989 RepID=A0A517P3N6_9PLAN|nr:lysophospholipid acyltransferase family protein [Alienimonas californiensis]QDT13984.1 1-acyl-sn-glycerol-3-phosphate acyltransferase [Alienimonas californiensis]
MFEPALIATIGGALLLSAVAAVWVWRRSGRSPHGRLVWLLYVLAIPLTGGLWRTTRNTPCPFPRGPSRPGDGDEPSPTAALIVANHRGPGDPMLLWSRHADAPEQIRPIAFLMARELYDVPRLKWFYDALDTIPVTRSGRDMKAVKVALKRLKDGGLVGLFPEGGINHNPDRLRPATPGAAFLALATDAPVFPVGLRNVPRGKNIYTALLKPARAEIHYGEPVDLSDLRGQKKTPAVLAEATERIMRRVADLAGEEYGGLEGDGVATPGDAAAATVAAPAQAA